MCILKEIEDGIKAKKITFSLVSDVDVEESMRFFNAKLKLSEQFFHYHISSVLKFNQLHIFFINNSIFHLSLRLLREDNSSW